MPLPHIFLLWQHATTLIKHLHEPQAPPLLSPTTLASVGLGTWGNIGPKVLAVAAPRPNSMEDVPISGNCYSRNMCPPPSAQDFAATPSFALIVDLRQTPNYIVSSGAH